ncbi:hypothetical protein C8F01DRAFT_1243721 [Mycena amicta]|nr:hypothetical protein C8F01DRAFT_1243721 [Mycena amicta]
MSFSSLARLRVPKLRLARFASTIPAKHDANWNYQDPLNLESLLTEEEIAVRDTARAYCQASGPKAT